MRRQRRELFCPFATAAQARLAGKDKVREANEFYRLRGERLRDVFLGWFECKGGCVVFSARESKRDNRWSRTYPVLVPPETMYVSVRMTKNHRGDLVSICVDTGLSLPYGDDGATALKNLMRRADRSEKAILYRQRRGEKEGCRRRWSVKARKTSR